MIRKDPEVTTEYRKDPNYEQFILRFNDALAPFQEEDYREIPDVYPTLHVVGAPRTGTTLLMQLIASHLDIGYVNNLIACFWRAPIYGIRLSRRLIPRGITSSFESDFGRTTNIQEPHEFGYFWCDVLGYDELSQRDASFEDKIEWSRLRVILNNMCDAFGGPVAFKSGLLAWHLAKVQSVLPKTCFVWVRRDPMDTALSLLGIRRRVLGSVEKWASLKPLEYGWLQHEPYWRQVVGQVFFLERAIERQVELAGRANVLELRYEELCGSPEDSLRRIRDLLAMNGGSVNLLSEPSESLSPRRQSGATTEEVERVREAVADFYSGRYD